MCEKLELEDILFWETVDYQDYCWFVFCGYINRTIKSMIHFVSLNQAVTKCQFLKIDHLFFQMAKAGFIYTPSDNSPDIAMCFFCLKELEGWEPEDDPE